MESVIFHRSFFGKRPETFDTIDVDFTISEPFIVIDTSMLTSVGNKTVITSESVLVDQASSFDFLDSEFRNISPFTSRQNFDRYLAAAF